MTERKNIKLDLLFRIDFFALTKFGVGEYTDEEKFEEEKKELKNIFGFRHYFKRAIHGYEYVRLSELEQEPQPYIKYLKSLENINLFECCQLEQAIGVFQDEKMSAFLATDTGLCYDSPGHFGAVAKILNKGESDLFEINTFYGKVVGDTIELLYAPKSSNIDIDKTEENIQLSFDKNEFELEFRRLINRVNDFFRDLKSKLRTELTTQERIGFVEEVFTEIATEI